MYKAKIAFDYQNNKGAIIKAMPGDCIPDFDSWPLTCQLAHKRMDWVEEVQEEKPQEEVIQKGKRSSKK